jgi:hypothetical protein
VQAPAALVSNLARWAWAWGQISEGPIEPHGKRRPGLSTPDGRRLVSPFGTHRWNVRYAGVDRHDGLRRVTRGCRPGNTAQRSPRALDQHRGTTRRGCLLFITFFTLLTGPSEDNVFGYGYFVGVLALAIWAIATSIAQYRAVATTALESPPTTADS